MANAYEERGRARKVLALVAAIDRGAINQGLSPYEHAGRIQLASLGWSDDHWALIARLASDSTGRTVNPPSAETRRAVRDVYIERAKAPVQRRAS